MARPRVARLFQPLEFGQQQTGVRNRVDADVVAASVCGTPPQRDIEPCEPAMGGTDRQLRRLGDDSGIGADPLT